MARLRSVTGRVGSDVALVTRFLENGQLFAPYAINSVTVYDAETGGNLVATLSVTNTSTGVYQGTWSISSSQVPGVYYDRWDWTASSASLGPQVRAYSFRVDAAIVSEPVLQETGPLFVGHREINFFNTVTKELIQRIVRQRLTYYSVSEEHTKTNDLYGEAKNKTVFNPVEINALVLYNEPSQAINQFSIDTSYTIEIYFHLHELAERNVAPREGDFVKFGEVLYEIEKLVQPQIYFGQIDNKVMTKATCRVSRKSQLDILEQ